MRRKRKRRRKLRFTVQIGFYRIVNEQSADALEHIARVSPQNMRGSYLGLSRKRHSSKRYAEKDNYAATRQAEWRYDPQIAITHNSSGLENLGLLASNNHSLNLAMTKSQSFWAL